MLMHAPGRHALLGSDDPARGRKQLPDIGARFCHPRQQRRPLPQFDMDAIALVAGRSEEHTSELQSLMRISYAVFCLKKKNTNTKEKITCKYTVTKMT